MKKLVMVLMIVGSLSLGAAVSWTGASTADKTDWGDPANWSGNAVPTAEDDVTISSGLPSGLVIRLGANRAVKSLSLGTVRIDGAGAYSLTIASGKLSAVQNATPWLSCTIVNGASGIWKSNGWAKPIRVAGAVSGTAFVTDASANSTIEAYGDLAFSGTLQLNNYQLTLGGSGEKSRPDGIKESPSGGRIVTAGAVQIDSCLLRDGADHRTKVALENKNGVENDRLGDGVPLVFCGTGGNLSLNGNAASAVTESVGDVTLSGGMADFSFSGTSASFPGTLSVKSLARSSGALLRITSDTTSKIMRIDGLENSHGLIGPWALSQNSGGYLTMDANDATRVIALDVTKLPVLAATGNSDALPVRFQDTSCLLGEKANLWALCWTRMAEQTLELGANDLSLQSGGMLIASAGRKRITSEGGALRFGADEIVLVAKNNTPGTTNEISAPIVWDRPSGSAKTYPDLTIDNEISDGRILFNGADRIGDYGNLYVHGQSDKTYLEFAGASDRVFHGSLGGVFRIVKSGTGLLSFMGSNDSCQRAFVYANEGEVRFSGSSFPLAEVSSGAVATMVDGASCRSAPIIRAGGCMAGCGALPNMGKAQALDGCRFAPGVSGQPGLLTMDTFTPGGDFAIDVTVTATSNSLFQVKKQYFATAVTAKTNPEILVRVSDPARGQASLKPEREIIVFKNTDKDTGDAKSNLEAISVRLENGTPKFIDMSGATIEKRIDGKSLTVVVSGLKSISRGIVIICR